MKRILAITLALILILSCCPSVYAAAEGFFQGSSSASEMDPHIKEIIESQMTQEERDDLIALDPSLSDKVIIRVRDELIYAHIYVSTKESFFREIGSSAYDPHQSEKFYYVFSDRPYYISIRNGKLIVRGEATHFIRDIINLPAEVEVNGKLSTVTGIYCFQMNAINKREYVVCITTESEALFKYYIGLGACKATYSEADFLKYGAEFLKYMTTMSKNAKGQPAAFRDMFFYDFVNNYDQYKAEMNERIAQQRIYKIKQAVATYGPIALGVVLVAGCAVTGLVIYRKRKKKALAIQDTPDTTDTTEPIPDPTDS